jgi:hypothetical protein
MLRRRSSAADNQETWSKYLKVELVVFRLAQHVVAEDSPGLAFASGGRCDHISWFRDWRTVACSSTAATAIPSESYILKADASYRGHGLQH